MVNDLVLRAQMDALEGNLVSVERILAKRWIKDEDRFTTITTVLNGEVRKKKKDIDDIRVGLDKGEKTITAAWGDYTSVRKESRELIRECHDFLSGIAIRNRQNKEDIDNNLECICHVADTLFGRYQKSLDLKWNSITVPGKEPLVASPARLVRIRFPEWDIWSLPFAFHEFGHIVATQSQDFQDFLEETPGAGNSRFYLNELFADAFATYVLGPAYVCACILLRFDPDRADEEGKDRASFIKREYLILKTLEEMDGRQSKGSGILGKRENGPYHEIIQQLQGAWDGAVAGAGSSTDLSSEEMQLLDAWFDGIWNVLQFEAPEYKRWPTVKVLSDKLLGEESASEKLDGWEEVIDVPNAAWHCRLYSEPKKMDEISRKSAELCEAIIAREAQKEEAPGSRTAYEGARR